MAAIRHWISLVLCSLVLISCGPDTAAGNIIPTTTSATPTPTVGVANIEPTPTIWVDPPQISLPPTPWSSPSPLTQREVVDPRLPVGTQAALSDGGRVIVHRVEVPLADRPYTALPPGVVTLGADVERCAGNVPVSVSGRHFRVVMDNSKRAQQNPGQHDPVFHEIMLAPGDCQRGWVTFSAPAELSPRAVVYHGPGAEAGSIRWRLD